MNNNHLIIGIGIIVVLAGAFLLLEEKEPLSVTVQGSLDGQYLTNDGLWAVPAGETVKIHVNLYNPTNTINTYKASIFTHGEDYSVDEVKLLDTQEVVLRPGETDVSSYDYTVPSTFGSTVRIDSFVKTPPDETFIHDDSDAFFIGINNLLWWHDDISTTCEQRAFTGCYMYESLRTFNTQAECEASLNTL